MTELSIIVPCYNDEQVLEDSIRSVNDVVTHASLSVETIIVDDESTDRTREVAKELIESYPALHIRVLARKRRRRGFGVVVRYGMAHATGRFCALVSSDGYDPVELLPQFLQKLRSGCQLVQCSRYIRAEDLREVPFSYRIYQSIYRTAVRLLLGAKIRDTTYGFRAFDRIYVQALGTSSSRFNICPEITFKVLTSGGKIEYIPGRPKPFTQGGSVKFQLPFEIWGYAYVLFRAALHRIGILWF